MSEPFLLDSSEQVVGSCRWMSPEISFQSPGVCCYTATGIFPQRSVSRDLGLGEAASGSWPAFVIVNWIEDVG